MKSIDIIRLIENDTMRMNILRDVASLGLPDWWIGAGFVRNCVWDYLHGYKVSSPLNDVDVIYFDMSDFTAQEAVLESTPREDNYQELLRKKNSNVMWSVTNQARMHIFHNDQQYQSSEDALAHWVETATCIGVRLNKDNTLELIAPYGLDDLTQLIVRPTPYHKDNLDEFYNRIEKKKWLTLWAKLHVVEK